MRRLSGGAVCVLVLAIASMGCSQYRLWQRSIKAACQDGNPPTRKVSVSWEEGFDKALVSVNPVVLCVESKQPKQLKWQADVPPGFQGTITVDWVGEGGCGDNEQGYLVVTGDGQEEVSGQTSTEMPPSNGSCWVYAATLHVRRGNELVRDVTVDPEIIWKK